MKPRAAPAVLLASLVLSLFVPFATSQATDGPPESFGVTPVTVSLTDPPLVRGGAFRATLRIQNGFHSPTAVDVTPEGTVAPWLSFEPAGTFEIPADGTRTLTVNVAVPADAPNGEHRGTIRIRATGTGEPAGSGAALNVEVAPAVRILVAGEQVLRFAAANLKIADAASGAPIAVAGDFANRGNVRAAPTLALVVKDADGAEVLREDLQGTPVLPGARETQTLRASRGLPAGLYEATATLANAATGSEPFPLSFRVLAEGASTEGATARVQGSLKKLFADPAGVVGEVVALSGEFANTGPVEIRDAKFTVGVFLAGRRVAVESSEPLRVPAGETVTLDAFFSPEKPGEHTFKGYVSFEGFRTPMKEGRFTVTGAERSGDSGSGTPLPPVALLLAAVGLAGLLLGRRNR
ncbi:MAG: COG1470 family protein [Methanobacteriota archaeon]